MRYDTTLKELFQTPSNKLLQILTGVAVSAHGRATDTLLHDCTNLVWFHLGKFSRKN